MERSTKREVGSAFTLAAVVKGLIFVAFLVSNVIALILMLTGNTDPFVRNMSNYDNWGSLLFNFSVMVLTVFCPVLFFFGRKRKGWFQQEVFFKKPSLTETGTVVGYSVVFIYFCQFAGVLLIQMLLALLGKTLPSEEVNYPTAFPQIVMLCIVVALLPALFEELCVRGAVLSVLKRYGVGFACVISALVFMMLHNTLVQLPLAFGAGLSFAFCIFKFRSIWPAMVSHFVVNLNSCILCLILSIPSENLRGFVFLAYVFSFFSLIGALLLMGIILHGFRLPKYEKPSPETKKMRRKLLLTTPSVYVFSGLFLCMLAYNLLTLFLS